MTRFLESQFKNVNQTELNEEITFYSAQLAANDPCEDQIAFLNARPRYMWGIFDGHGGVTAANYLKSHLLAKCIKHKFKKAFNKTDNELLGRKKLFFNPAKIALCGSCALVAEYNEQSHNFTVALTGDSRAISGQNIDKQWLPMDLTFDQTCTNADEIERLKREDKKFAIKNDRILGIFQPTRTFGDGALKWTSKDGFEMKNFVSHGLAIQYPNPPYLTPEPQVSHYMLQHHEFVVMGSDGLYDLLSNEEIVSFVGSWIDNKLRGNMAAMLIENALIKHDQLDRNLFELGSTAIRQLRDDISVYVIIRS